MYEYRAIWSGTTGGTGYSVFHFDGAGSATAIPALVHTFFDGNKAFLPNEVSIDFDAEVIQKANDGTLIGAVAVTPPTTVVGQSASAFSMPAGLRVTWETGTIVNGRRLRGRTYIVPSVGAADATGTPSTASMAALKTAADALINASVINNTPLAVWSRANSAVMAVTSAVVSDRTAVLRSRRD